MRQILVCRFLRLHGNGGPFLHRSIGGVSATPPNLGRIAAQPRTFPAEHTVEDAEVQRSFAKKTIWTQCFSFWFLIKVARRVFICECEFWLNKSFGTTQGQSRSRAMEASVAAHGKKQHFAMFCCDPHSFPFLFPLPPVVPGQRLQLDTMLYDRPDVAFRAWWVPKPSSSRCGLRYSCRISQGPRSCWWRRGALLSLES